MNNYDFNSLNDKEFEAFVADLLSCEFKCRVDRFKPGKDGGVDGRWLGTDGGETIVQCKHWLKSGYPRLFKHLKEVELPKIHRLTPARYILVTSVPLSRKNKKDLQAALAPHVKSETDIIGPENLNDFLATHSEVEQRQYKLWLSSISSLGFILNNAVLGRSSAVVREMHDQAVLYVATSDYAKAIEHLNKKRVLILTGEPGVGKTTLASQLVLQHASRGYQIITLEEGITEGEAVYTEIRKQLFYFDDFLGRTYLEALKPKHDSHVAAFMRRIAKDPSKRFVLTSRTNILNQGAVLSDLIAAETGRTYELSVGSLQIIDRARILYNHMWHSELEPEFIDEIYREKRYHNVIKHANFNPRLISFILDAARIDRRAEDYWDYVSKTLNNPQEVWEHCFTAQLTQDCRDLVYLTVLNGGRISETLLQEAFFRSSETRKNNPGHTDNEFRVAISHATGSVLNRTQHSMSVVYSLFNPSIADYVLRKFGTSTLWDYYFPLLRTRSALNQLLSLKNQDFFGRDAFRRVLRAIATAEQASEPKRDDYSLKLACMLATDFELGKEFADLVRPWITTPVENVVKLYGDEFLNLLVDARMLIADNEVASGVTQLHTIFGSDYLPIENTEVVKRTLEMMEQVGLAADRTAFRQQLLEDWHYKLDEMLREEGILNEYDAPHMWSEANKAVVDYVTKNLTTSGIQPSTDELTKVVAGVDIHEVLASNEERSHFKSDSVTVPAAQKAEADQTKAVDDLFFRDDRSTSS